MQQFIANRPTHVIYLLNIIIVFTIGTERLFICITQIWSFTTNIPQWATYMFLSATWVTCMNLFAIKAYYFYYIKEYNKSISDTVWVATINSDNIENNWFIQNKNRFGNIYFLLKLNIIPCCISILIITISSHYFNSLFIFIIIYNLLCLIPVFISFIVLYKIHKHEYQDIYGMQREIMYQSILLLIGIILSLICGIITTYNHRIFWLCQIYLSLIIASSLTLVSTKYLIYHCNQQKQILDLENQTFSTVARFKLGNLTKTDKIVIADLEAAICKYEPFRLFMKYLVTEFATESLSFLVELIQIKYQFQVENNHLIRVPKYNRVKSGYYLNQIPCDTHQSINSYSQNSQIDTDNNDRKDDKNDNAKYITLDFNITEKDKNNECVKYTFLFHGNNSVLTKLSIADKLPQSQILTRSKLKSSNDNNLCNHMLELYYKYIKFESNYELNISYGSRQALQLFFECENDGLNTFNYYLKKKEYFQVFNVFDEIGLEILWLLQQSFYRFTQSSHFERKLMFNLRKPDNEIYPDKRHASSYFKVREQYSK